MYIIISNVCSVPSQQLQLKHSQDQSLVLRLIIKVPRDTIWECKTILWSTVENM